MKTPLLVLDLVPGLAAAAPMFRSPRKAARDAETDDIDENVDSAFDDDDKTGARQDCKPP